MVTLIHFAPMFPFNTPRNHKKTLRFHDGWGGGGGGGGGGGD